MLAKVTYLVLAMTNRHPRNLVAKYPAEWSNHVWDPYSYTSYTSCRSSLSTDRLHFRIVRSLGWAISCIARILSMARFASEAELESFLGRLDPDYAGVASAIHAKDIQARAEPRGPLLTLRDLVKQPLAKMRRRLTDRAPATKTKAVSPRTFSEVLPWDVFTPAALAQLQELDDTASCYMPQVYTPAGEAEGLVSPADEAEVRGYVFGFLQLLNHVASRCGLGVEYVGSGSNRNFCFTDLLLRQGNTDLTQLSSANWAVIGVKGPWQLRLPEDVSLGDSLNQPGYRKAVLPAMQQAYGDAVAEEAPIFAITNYDVTMFCRRSKRGGQAHLGISTNPMEWHNLTSSCSLHLICQGDEGKSRQEVAGYESL
ncbi:hypothetical protein WJX79_006174 [Trebouxia sp. C0005]